MKTTNTHHEILFFIDTSLASRQLSDTKENINGKTNSAIEELEKACWNGIIYEMFPEILSSFYPKCQSFLWHVLSGKNFLYINIGPNPVKAEHDTSIDPYFFMMTICENWITSISKENQYLKIIYKPKIIKKATKQPFSILSFPDISSIVRLGNGNAIHK